MRLTSVVCHDPMRQNRDPLPSLDLEGDFAQDRVSGFVGERHGLEADISSQCRAETASGLSSMSGSCWNTSSTRSPAATPFAIPAGVLGEVTHGPEGVLEVGQEDDERAGGELSAKHKQDPKYRTKAVETATRRSTVRSSRAASRAPLTPCLRLFLFWPEKASRNDRSKDNAARSAWIRMPQRRSTPLEPSRRRWSPESLVDLLGEAHRRQPEQRERDQRQQRELPVQQEEDSAIPTRTKAFPSKGASP